jgi:hypothetical protein
VERAPPHTRQTRAKPSGWPGEGELAWLLVQLHCHRRFAQLCAEAAAITITAIARLLLQRLLARSEERLAPRRETGGGDPQLTRQEVKRFPSQQT